jgi:hypothetical protein
VPQAVFNKPYVTLQDHVDALKLLDDSDDVRKAITRAYDAKKLFPCLDAQPAESLLAASAPNPSGTSEASPLREGTV